MDMPTTEKHPADARIEGNPPEIKLADRRVIAMGGEDKKVNAANPDFRGVAVVTDVPARVVSSGIFSGCLHYALSGRTSTGEAWTGWVPAFLCEIPETAEAARLVVRYRL